MDMFTPYIIWNVFITLVLAPLMFGIRKNESELKRQDILLNKTREEIAGRYVTKQELLNNMDAVIDRLEKMDEKIDRLFDIRYNK
tara:strand:+ start:882 stop:1136 length:255 start_codon:yes stop_codon:yes gene_type:complete